MIEQRTGVANVFQGLEDLDAPAGASDLRTPTELDLITRIARGDQVEMSVASLTADTGIQGIAIGRIYQSWAIHEKPLVRALANPDEIGKEVMRVEDACRAYLGSLDATESQLAVERALGVLGRAANWDRFSGEFLFHIYAARDVFRDADFIPLIEQYRGCSRPVPDNLTDLTEQFRQHLLETELHSQTEVTTRTEQFRSERIAEHQLSLLNSLKEEILPELRRMHALLEEEVRKTPVDKHSFLAEMPADKIFICFARDVAQKVRQGFDAEATAYMMTESKVEILRQENEEIQARLEKQGQKLREGTDLQRDLRAEYADRSSIKENHNRIAEYVGLRTTLLRCLRGEFLDLRASTRQSDDMVVIVGDLAVPCSLQAIPPYVRAGMICSEKSGIGHTELAFTSTMKPIAGASDVVLEILRTCGKDTVVIYDGGRHLLTVNPTPETIQKYRAERDQLMVQIKQPLPEIPQRDRLRPVEVMINVRSAQKEVIDALRAMGASVGLYTPESDSEFESLMERTEVGRQEYIFGKLLSLDQEITIRAFDFSGDKFSYRKDDNIRDSVFARDHSWTTRDELIAQFKAVIRAGAGRTHPFTLLFPNVTGASNLSSYLEAVDRAYEREKSFPATGLFRAGVQIESIAAVQNTLKILRGGERPGRDPEIRLVAIGTNDLGMEVTQHEAGHAGDDRTNARVNHYNPELFAHIRSVRQQLDQYNQERRAQQRNYQDIPLEVCGVMASQRILVPVLIGLGVNKFSVGIGSGHDIARLISRFDEESCIKLVDRLIKMGNSDLVKDALIEFWDEKLGLLDFDVRKDGEIVPIFSDEV